jgi:branched-chain amino acid transport system permease protein
VSLFFDAVITGVAVGSVYGLIAIGYTIIFNATRIFNLAQGDLVMAGVLLSYLVLDVWHGPQVAALAFAVGGVTILALIEERLVVRPFIARTGDSIGWFIATLAFGLIVEAVATRLYGDHPPLAVPSPLPQSVIRLGPLTTTWPYVLAFVSLVAVTVAIEAFYGRTWIGRAMRAVAGDRELAALRGIEPTRISSLAFAIAGAVAGLAGYVVAPIVYANVSIGLTYSIKGFIALAIGGFGSIRGAFTGALILGVGEQLFDLYVNPRYEVLAGAALLMLILLVRPTGLFTTSLARRV